jgi:hypothetical protein
MGGKPKDNSAAMQMQMQQQNTLMQQKMEEDRRRFEDEMRQDREDRELKRAEEEAEAARKKAEEEATEVIKNSLTGDETKDPPMDSMFGGGGTLPAQLALEEEKKSRSTRKGYKTRQTIADYANTGNGLGDDDKETL